MICIPTFGTPCISAPKFSKKDKGKGKAALDRPGEAWTVLRFPGVEAPRFQDNRHMNVVKLSALRTGHLYPPGNSPCTHFC